MAKVIPSKGALISGLIVTFVGMLIYNKVPAVRRLLGGA